MPYGNKCRARAVIHTTIMALHPDPNKNMLMDLKNTHTGKHPRELMAVAIVKGNIIAWHLTHTWKEDESKMNLV